MLQGTLIRYLYKNVKTSKLRILGLKQCKRQQLQIRCNHIMCIINIYKLLTFHFIVYSVSTYEKTIVKIVHQMFSAQNLKIENRIWAMGSLVTHNQSFTSCKWITIGRSALPGCGPSPTSRLTV